ncbi:MAG: hypothetical protein AUH15_04500 [Acidobacteriales bacterium 13_2_20CM_55_8]|jgi:hypothetical protein|nr:MAG: hypothetical protein AUH15_04500 [Acidobacteriales bacterium 13_2_20CM_55_8]
MDDSSNIQEILSRSDSIGVNEVSFCCQNFLSRFANMQMKLSTGSIPRCSHQHTLIAGDYFLRLLNLESHGL